MLRCSTCPLVIAAVDCAGAVLVVMVQVTSTNTRLNVQASDVCIIRETRCHNATLFVALNQMMRSSQANSTHQKFCPSYAAMVCLTCVVSDRSDSQFDYRMISHRYRALLPAPADSGDNNATQLENLLSYLQECCARATMGTRRSKIFLRARAVLTSITGPK